MLIKPKPSEINNIISGSTIQPVYLEHVVVPVMVVGFVAAYLHIQCNYDYC